MSDETTQLVHHLQAPLIMLKARLEHALLEAACGPDGQRLLRDCLEEVDSLRRMVSDLLLLDRADSGRLAGHRHVLDLSRVLMSVGKSFEPLALSRNVQLVVRTVEPLPVKGNEHQLRRVLSCVLDNALKFTGRGGRVSLVGRRDGRIVEAEVTDTGCGIPAHALERLFERFYQVDEEASRAAGGVGLGLSIARALAAENGGTIEVESSPGTGSTFRLKIPCHE